MSENETENETVPMLKVGDPITSARGKYRGVTGKVLAVDTANAQYAVSLPTGEVTTINHKNLRTAGTATVSVANVVETLAKVRAGVGVPRRVIDQIADGLGVTAQLAEYLEAEKTETEPADRTEQEQAPAA